MTNKTPIPLNKARQMFSAFPVALVTAGDNVASYALVHIFSFEPHLLGVGVKRSRFTYDEIERVGDFGINLPGKDMGRITDICGSHTGRKVDKFEKAGITRMKAEKINSVLVEECLVNYECKLYKKIEMPEASHDWFLGEIVAAHKTKGAVAEDTILYWNSKYYQVGEVVHDRKR